MRQFLTFYELLVEWNRRMNLTTITEFDDVVTKHFLDSLCLIRAVPDLSGPASRDIIDVGTGAGFPGIPLKIAFPKLNLVLLDSANKKLNFLIELIRQLGLSGVTTVHGRAEDLAHEADFRRQFDLCVSRAVSDLSVLAEYCLPFVKIGGLFVAYKTADVDGEYARAKKAVYLMGGKTAQIIKYQLPATGISRSLVCIEKKKGTPREYPRKAGTPMKNPLK